MYFTGEIVGSGGTVALACVSPCSVAATAPRLAMMLRGLNALQAMAGALNCYDKANEGNYLAAGIDAVGVLENIANVFLACSAAGTSLLTPTGSKLVEDIEAGDLLLA